MSKLYLFFGVCCFLNVCVGQIVQNGQCDPNIPVAQNFNLDLFGGIWYEVIRSDRPVQNSQCSSIEIINNNDTINAIFSGVNRNFAERSFGNLTAATADSPKFILDIPIFNNPIDFWITLSNDNHTDLAVAYSCENITLTTRGLQIWVLGRRSEGFNSITTHIINVHLNETFGVELDQLSTVDHSDSACFELPIIDPGQSIIIPGQCRDDIPVQQAFNVSGFMGTWHEISSYFTENSIGGCIRAEYSIGDDVVDVLNSQVINQELLTITGNASVISTDLSARLRVTLDVGPNQTTGQELWILETDYENYAISYSCQNVSSDERRIFSWILSRERVLNPSAQVKVNNFIESILELNHAYFTPTDQSNEACFFFPEPSDRPVVFRGQCDDLNITAMPAFKPEEYMGLWHNIELYPSLFQDGTCSNARYALNDGQVDVLNTQVRNETLDTIQAVAVLASYDGSAKLNVTFPIVGTDLTVTTNYWVLDTNYTSYALVYSCNNIDADNMQVSSWKLSRTRTLIDVDREAINAVMNTTKVLDDLYFVTVNQTEEGCFFVPIPEEGVPVVFPGRCDPDLGMENFNLSLFVGTWFEIQAYPKEEQTGQCISHEYTFVSNSELSFISSSVDDNFLSETQGQLISTDSTGRLTINITTGNQTIEIPFWIIDTDYTNYALAYACVDQPGDLRAVWSWKLSRTTELSPAAETNISNAMANIDVLENKYFWNIDHSEQTCFVLPVIPSGAPIIVPGLCDPTIRGVPNFNITAYSGRWRFIESYYSEFESGSCNEAIYNQIDALTLGVTNVQVINQTLSSFSGNATLISNDESGTLQFSFTNNAEPSDIIILDTDYISYAFAYSCQNITATNERRVWSWKLSRSNTLSEAAIANITQIINTIDVLNQRYYSIVDRTEAGCFYFPEVDTSLPVRFRGKCDESIPVVQDFKPVEYMGLWHDMRSYPELFQTGTCQNAYYTLVGGVVDVFNTQVINQTLDTMSGTAVASDDGSARLNVTFNVGGIEVSSNYWVLATNYTSYALVYSCRQVDEEYYQVTSWQLSRTRELTNESIEAMNAVIDQIPVLDDRYYINRKQSPEDCFFFPEPVPNTPVIFPGQCDDTIEAVSNFNSTQFAGVWHEIAKYPYGPNDNCIDHRFELGSSSIFTHNSFHVRDQELLLVNNSTVNLTSTDGTGRLTIDIVVNGTVQTIPFWILATDYSNYTLAYGCRNLENDFRQIYSWKLSRTRQPGNEILAALNASMSDIYVLDNKYYDTIQQTDEACFYLPDIGLDEPVTFIGQCDRNIPVVTNFNVTAYLGTWRLIETYFAEFQMGSCSQAEYSPGNDSVVVFNSQVVNQTLDTITGTAVPAGTDGEGRLLVSFPTSPTPSEYWILGTDYESYALVYTCENIDQDRRRVWSWKLSRSNTLSDVANANITQIINTIDVLNQQYYSTVDRTEAGCFYFPEVDPSLPVRFRGKCNESIPVVENFNPVQYMGLWHDMRSYPELFQTGTCQNAYYTLVGGVVDVFNTQVINQTLDTMSGTAVASDDGSARLNVTFNVGGIEVSSNYWVLATNYTSYALVYSCRQVDEEYYQVTSWQLSRTRELTNESIEAMNAVIDQIPVLDDRYYINRKQSPEDCFFFPEPVPNTPVIFPGQCDDTIEAVSNFNSTQFAGVWHEIAKYPYGPNDDCIDHRFELGSSSIFTHNSFHVRDQELLLVNNSTVNLTSTDGTGRLTIDIVVNGTVQTIPFWILATDYSNYTLAYGCRNLENDFRQIYSWKLSRTRQPGNEILAALNASMSDIYVLDNKYYDTIQQTDEACFYLPDIGLDEPVTFIGQCDRNIPVVTNFNVTAYLGTWRLIETYFAEFQMGTCSQAEYSPGNDSVVVFNSQVVNQTLDTITGTAVPAGTDGEGRLLVSFPTSPTPSEYWILGTDYESYALVYTCENIDQDRRRVWSWKLSRSNTLSDVANANITQIINTIDVLNQQYYSTVDRTEAGCFYFPEVDPSLPVRFRGKCNESIPVVENFNPVQYMGLWHDMRSYPELFQTGTCQNAYYTLVGGVVDVFNTQVINQTLDTMSGTAVASDDGSARLNVTFNVGGIEVSSNYWVLATNYTSYALVYSCRQVDEEYYQVTSWQLSRTRELTNESIEAMNAVIDQIPVLDDRYYINRKQSPEDCFFFPEPVPNTPVIFPGQCDDTIEAVSNFNSTQFAGVWHEIAKYPYGPNDDCIDHRFELGSSSSFTHNSFHVRDQKLLLVNNSTVNLTSNDGTGRLTIDIVVNETVQTIPFWILATDYSNYALAYGCQNLENDFRQIYSWQLSRTRQPDNAILAAFNASMSDIYVLDNKYFDTIQQTDEACFYLPDIGLDEPVTFIGQCDRNIPVVTNFNVTAYLGTWRLIETYFAEFQIGTCSQAEYSPGNDSVVVFNSQVVNQTLDTITGTAVPAGTDGEGRLLVSFPTSPTPTEYWILGTDYESYALVYTCENISNDRRRVWSWKLSRTTSLTDNATAEIDRIVNSTDVLNNRFYQDVDHSDNACFYYPEPNESTPVIFRGQCDTNITAMANFSVERYLGVWYDIESYPAPFQTGTCSRAEYLLNVDGSVRVENSQVVDKLLETWIGTAVIVSDDESAKLNVTFNVNGINVTSTLWILDTDYQSYALAYSCENITPNSRAVFSWKLSRFTTLLPNASEAIDNIVDSIQVLKQKYFIERGHTEEDCFYYPDNNGGNVILPGQCLASNEVPAVGNFSVDSYTGTWYQIARFPNDLHVGECISTNYSTSGPNALVASRTIVVNETQVNFTLQGTVSADGRGILTINNNNEDPTRIYILGIDYEEYVLAYSCRNLEGNEKQIFSWILSRSRDGISDAAQKAISELVESNIDLWEGYFVPTLQDNDACFFYPPVDQLPGTVDLPGPCPTNINGVPNFNAPAYLGRWYEIERYLVQNQFGQCSRAEYSLGSDNGTERVVVLNNEVLNQTLFTQSGFADVASTDGSGVLSVEFVVNGVLSTTDYYILATDYDSFSLVYSCTNLTNGWRRVSSWKLSRYRYLTPNATAAIDAVIATTQGLNQEFYQPTSQSDEDCFYIPYNYSDRAPRFRGQCENITGVANFDVQRYLGWWHEIERYPLSDANAGECRSSDYELDDSTYRVVDTRVLDNQGFVVTGTVTATNEGKLVRTMATGTTQDIWVLATDYTNYALLYACEQVDNEYREVWSAKHSRSRSLSAVAQDIVAPIISDNSVLYPQFYQNVDQSDGTCFHYPAIAPGQPIVIPGQCDLGITVVQNLNINDFSGTWYQTERYDAVGETSCIGTRFIVQENSGIINVYHVEVRDEQTVNTEGTATVTESSGLIQITFSNSEGNSTTSWYILETDYTSYAVAYNCININNYQRQVRAWKLSRERELPSESVEAIERLINRKQELHRPYFTEIVQNDDCPEPSSALFIKSSIIVLLISAMFQWLL